MDAGSTDMNGMLISVRLHAHFLSMRLGAFAFPAEDRYKFGLPTGETSRSDVHLLS
jgi:hypothetical protein